MNEAYGHRYLITRSEHACLQKAYEEILGMKSVWFDYYDNPFESKFTVRDKHSLPPAVESVVHHTEHFVRRAVSERRFKVSLDEDESRHYCGVFKYVEGDHLNVHVDAGIHPIHNSRKRITAILYLGPASGGPLEFWSGTSCMDPNPRLFERFLTIQPEHGRLVLFENTDFAWHGMPIYHGEEPRVVITVSYLSSELEEPFQNMRQRAFFVPRPDEIWSPETLRLRDQRADSKEFATAYRRV